MFPGRCDYVEVAKEPTTVSWRGNYLATSTSYSEYDSSSPPYGM